MKKIGQQIKNLWKDESGQGATEYILMLVIVIAVAMVFKEKIMSIVNSKLENIGSDLGGFNSNR